MRFIESFKAWWSGKVSAHRAKAAAKREAAMRKESCLDIQVMEFGGNMYVAYGGMPIVRIDRLNVEPTQLLAEARKDFVEWRKQFGRRYA